MSFIRLTVESNLYNCNIEFDRHIIFIKGNSGVGKTSLVDILSESNSSDVNITCTIPYMIVNDTTWKAIMSSVSNTLLIFDDMSVVETPEFASIYKETALRNNNYFKIMSRENYYDLRTNDNYIFVCDGKNHYIKLIDEL